MIRQIVMWRYGKFSQFRSGPDLARGLLQAWHLLMDGMYTALDRFADSEIQKNRAPDEESAVPTVTQAIARGLRGVCPRCTHAKLFRAFLKPFDACPACGQDWTPQRADDFPAYLVILLVGHLLTPIVIAVELNFVLPTGVQMVLWPSLVLILILALIGPTKGAVIAVQWRLGVHGFTKPVAPMNEESSQDDHLP